MINVSWKEKFYTLDVQLLSKNVCTIIKINQCGIALFLGMDQYSNKKLIVEDRSGLYGFGQQLTKLTKQITLQGMKRKLNINKTGVN